jgi:FkbM family methyltransferase
MNVRHRFGPRMRQWIREAVPPRLRIHWVALRNWLGGEPELRVVAWLCDPTRASIDVGASMGIYAYFMRRRSGSVVLMEPRPAAANWLRRAFGESRVLQIAASDRSGTVQLRIPHDPRRRGMATIEAANRLDDVELDLVDVAAEPLDNLDLGSVGLIKIDVEGHESAVIRGAARIIAADHPVVIVEAEERHRPGAVTELRAVLSGYGYDGWFLRGGRVLNMSEFDVRRDQPSHGVTGGTRTRRDRYINNFIFIHRDDTRRARLLRRRGLRSRPQPTSSG